MRLTARRVEKRKTSARVDWVFRIFKTIRVNGMNGFTSSHFLACVGVHVCFIKSFQKKWKKIQSRVSFNHEKWMAIKKGWKRTRGEKSFRKLSKHNSVNIFIVVYPVVEQEELETCFAKWENLKWMERQHRDGKIDCRINVVHSIWLMTSNRKQGMRAIKKVYSKLLAASRSPLILWDDPDVIKSVDKTAKVLSFRWQKKIWSMRFYLHNLLIFLITDCMPFPKNFFVLYLKPLKMYLNGTQQFVPQMGFNLVIHSIQNNLFASWICRPFAIGHVSFDLI